ncbi:ribonucleoprotein [Mycoplasma wenyonii str. Massachusetts]|uniref:Ribonucleoprotein n=1 Tax=Mycoplasma wenyonii (strain Massachusetts) TaxID=1197325 RepID=I6ZJI6_MYCWM|nr:class Ib ribonucleoside-diphosphate reductase assembly flavoprotein NrdI [Mycoplasma wenyonii]AFN65360.1 ribonucleoprotein [Mycoplasma wenyonii str. Massachusetts]
MIELWYASRTGKVEQIVSKLGFKNVNRIFTGEEKATKQFVIFTYTDGYGEVPSIVELFLSNNHNLLIGVAGSGNINFGKNFCNAVTLISQKYGVPALKKFDLGGNKQLISEFREELKALNLS